MTWFPKKLSVVGREEIAPFIEYAKKKHGNNFVSLYEDSKVARCDRNLESCRSG